MSSRFVFIAQPTAYQQQSQATSPPGEPNVPESVIARRRARNKAARQSRRINRRKS